MDGKARQLELLHERTCLEEGRPGKAYCINVSLKAPVVESLELSSFFHYYQT